VSVVVDASILVAATGDAGDEGCWALELIGSDDLVAPHLVLVEASNVLRRLEISGRLSRSEAGQALQDLQRLGLQLAPFAPFAPRVWELRFNVSSYDAWYIALAEQLDAPLATLDRRLSAADGPRCRFLLPPQ
jgi:predicted nucleic acid-binding protein